MKKLLSTTAQKTPATSSSFSDFIRNAKAGEKKRVYKRVLIEASRKQNEVIAKAEKMAADAA